MGKDGKIYWACHNYFFLDDMNIIMATSMYLNSGVKCITLLLQLSSLWITDKEFRKQNNLGKPYNKAL